MRLALVYNPNDRKLKEYSYSYIYKGMLDALIEAFDGAQLIAGSCEAKDIKADVVIFFDPNSCHDITIAGIDKHPALKMEYLSDPHQQELHGIYMQDGSKVHKLGPEKRMNRLKERGIKFVISPVRDGFIQYLGQYVDDIRLLHFPFAPAFPVKRIKNRIPEVLANGCTWAADLRCYDFRKWAFTQPEVTRIEHYLIDNTTPHGKDYSDLLYRFAGGLALSEYYPVPKYYEMPLCGMVTFAQHHPEYEARGFKDHESCVYVTKTNFKDRLGDFLEHPDEYGDIAKAGQEVMKNYTARKFGEFIFNKAKEEA